MISKYVQNEIAHTRKCSERAGAIVINQSGFPTGDRDLLLIAYWALISEYHEAVLCLVESELFGAAFTLLQPLIQALVRAHVVMKGSKEELTSIRDDEYQINLREIGPQIDAKFSLGHSMEHFLNNIRNPTPHSHVYSALLQLGRRFNGNEIKQSYSDRELVELIRLTKRAVLMATNLVMKHFDLKKPGSLLAGCGKTELQGVFLSVCHLDETQDA